MEHSFYFKNHSSYSLQQNRSYPMIHYSRLVIDRGPLNETVSPLPNEMTAIKPLHMNEYNFTLELETIAQILEEREIEEMNRKKREQELKEAELKAQELAWKSLEEKRQKAIVSHQTKRKNNPETLIDLDFENEDSTEENVILQIPENEKMFHRLVDMGMEKEIILMGLEIFGGQSEEELVNFVTDFQKLKDQNFPKQRIQLALVLSDNNYEKAYQFLHEYESLSKAGITEEQISNALSMFNNKIEEASKWLISYKKMSELGFSDILIREALVMSNNSYERAVEYCLSSPQ